MRMINELSLPRKLLEDIARGDDLRYIVKGQHLTVDFEGHDRIARIRAVVVLSSRGYLSIRVERPSSKGAERTFHFQDKCNILALPAAIQAAVRAKLE